MSQKAVLITGCSAGGLGAALALEMDKAGYKVLATARNVSKMSSLPSSIEKLPLEVTSQDSVQKCVEEVRKITGGTLNILVNNAGVRTVSPITDLNINDGKKVFDTNVWAPLALSQAFLPLLLKAKAEGGAAIIANNSSIAAITALPFQSVYNASKATLSSFTTHLRHEIAPFGVQVVELRTGAVASDVFRLENKQDGSSVLPKGSLYEPSREKIDAFDRGETGIRDGEISAEDWAKGVTSMLSKSRLPAVFWSGGSSSIIWWTQSLPSSFFDSMMAKLTNLDHVWKWAKGQPPKSAVA